MGEYYRKPEVMKEVEPQIKQDETSLNVVVQIEEQADYDLVKDLLDDSETLVKGIILSEILGKPKATR